MPNIEVELAHLDQADRHMAIARDSLAAAETLSLQARPAEEAEDRLETFREALAAFEGHRANILKTIEGARWFSPALAGVAGASGLAVVVAGIVAHRRWSGAIVAATLLLMLGFQVLFMHGYRNSREGRSEMKPLATMILEQAPDASLYTSGTKRMRAPSDLSVYLNRPVPWVDEASQIPPSDRPAVLVVRQREHESPPLPPPGMTSIGKTSRSESWWHAFLMPNPNKKD